MGTFRLPAGNWRSSALTITKMQNCGYKRYIRCPTLLSKFLCSCLPQKLHLKNSWSIQAMSHKRIIINSLCWLIPKAVFFMSVNLWSLQKYIIKYTLLINAKHLPWYVSGSKTLKNKFHREQVKNTSDAVVMVLRTEELDHSGFSFSLLGAAQSY